MSAQHTPGPWRNAGRSMEGGLGSSRVAARTLIAHVYAEAFGDEAQERANADLIAAAPELLAALKDCLKFLEHDVRSSYSEPEKTKARAAIAKATGSAA